MVTDELRAYMYHKIREFRSKKPIFTMDFWNDGEFVGGCIAGGRSYLHINANGDLEPCAFIHYSDFNIKDKTLLEAFKSPLFMQYSMNQPFNENMLQRKPKANRRPRQSRKQDKVFPNIKTLLIILICGVTYETTAYYELLKEVFYA